MELKAKDIMVKDFSTIRPDAPVREAVRMILEGKPRQNGYKPFGIMVTDEIGRLVGMVSMFDILYHLRPPFMNFEMEGTPLRRLPVVDSDRILGIVYLSDVFYGLCGTWLECKVP
jgi:CBS domain-containing protein